jgi:hypothetical protein
MLTNEMVVHHALQVDDMSQTESAETETNIMLKLCDVNGLSQTEAIEMVRNNVLIVI